ncbi:MAG: HAD-IIB family hydrolase, partial [Clostridiales bacterium]|nr:HAD-IIB family hydrolase [Clostridiales bacterium]
MAGKTLYISDLDGTLLNSSAELTEYTARALGAMIAGGLNFSVATARTLASAGKILAGVELRAPIVLMNGALIYDAARERYVKIYRLPPETVAAAVRTLKAFAITGFMYELRDGELATYYESLEKKPLRDFVEERVARYGKPFLHAASFAGVPAEHIVYFALLDTQERLRPVRDALAALPGLNLAFYRDIYSSDMWYLEMFSARASKREAVAYLREALGYGRVVGFGDNLNDLPMFAACDEKVAVENAKPEVRAAADHICGANDSDGVARWLEQNARYIPCRSGRKEQEMSENTETPNTNSAVNYFQTGDKLASTVSKMTSGAGGKFQRRDFVSPLIDFCTDNCYNGKLGIVYGLRSTGKTVGMLQAAETLAERGYRAAYARFNYEETGMAAVTEEIKALSESGVTHFFVDEASYLSGFINLAPDWSDWLVPERGIKIIISGTDSFMLWTAQRTSLFHRYAQFSTNWNSFPEYRRVTGKPYDEYNREGGIFAVGEMPAFIQSAVVDNLLHTIAHCVDDANRTSS